MLSFYTQASGMAIIPKHNMEPAHSIIVELGGCRALARAIADHTGGTHKISSSAISRWMRPSHLKGTGGRVPLKHWAVLLQIGESRKKGRVIQALLDQHFK